jgi:regulator of sigma E protease
MDFLLDKLLNTAVFVLVLGVIIFVHEFGHFITAKLFGIRVFVFSFGFGRRLAGFKWGDTDCRLSLIPLGGYVKLEGEEDDGLSERQEVAALADGELVRIDSPNNFTNRPRWQRIVVYLAGPFMNLVLTVSILTGVYVHGADLPDYSDTPIVAMLDPDSPAQAAGIQPGDEIVAINGEATKTWEQVFMAVALRPDRDLDVDVRRGSEKLPLKVHSRVIDGHIGDIGAHPLVFINGVTVGGPADKAGIKPGDVVLRMNGTPIRKFDEIQSIVRGSEGKPVEMEISRQGQPVKAEVVPQGGLIGISGGPRVVYKKFPLPRAFKEAVTHTRELIKQTVQMLGGMLRRQISPRAGLSGPLQIFKVTGEAAKAGAMQVILLIAFVSLSVGILNLLPMPPLDGGHLAILVVESVVRRDLGPQAKGWIMNVGVALLLLLIVTVFYFDLTKQKWFANLLGLQQ